MDQSGTRYPNAITELVGQPISYQAAGEVATVSVLTGPSDIPQNELCQLARFYWLVKNGNK